MKQISQSILASAWHTVGPVQVKVCILTIPTVVVGCQVQAILKSGPLCRWVGKQMEASGKWWITLRFCILGSSLQGFTWRKRDPCSPGTERTERFLEPLGHSRLSGKWGSSPSQTEGIRIRQIWNVGRDVRACRTGSSGQGSRADGIPGAPRVQIESSEYGQVSHMQSAWSPTHIHQTHQRPTHEPGAKGLVLWRMFPSPRSHRSKYQETLWEFRDYHCNPHNHLLSVQWVLSINILWTLLRWSFPQSMAWDLSLKAVSLFWNVMPGNRIGVWGLGSIK